MDSRTAEALIQRALETRPDEWRSSEDGEPSPAWIARVAVNALEFTALGGS